MKSWLNNGVQLCIIKCSVFILARGRTVDCDSFTRHFVAFLQQSATAVGVLLVGTFSIIGGSNVKIHFCNRRCSIIGGKRYNVGFSGPIAKKSWNLLLSTEFKSLH